MVQSIFNSCPTFFPEETARSKVCFEGDHGVKFSSTIPLAKMPMATVLETS